MAFCTIFGYLAVHQRGGFGTKSGGFGTKSGGFGPKSGGFGARKGGFFGIWPKRLSKTTKFGNFTTFGAQIHTYLAKPPIGTLIQGTPPHQRGGTTTIGRVSTTVGRCVPTVGYLVPGPNNQTKPPIWPNLHHMFGRIYTTFWPNLSLIHQKEGVNPPPKEGVNPPPKGGVNPPKEGVKSHQMRVLNPTK